MEELYSKVNRGLESVHVALYRVPITDEQAPLAPSIDTLIHIVYSNFQDYFVFNCQIGRGRTTTGMVICSMALTFKRGEWRSLANRLPDTPIYDSKQKELQQGLYPCVMELIGMMKWGSKAKRKLDYIIDLTSDMQNIREVIYNYHVFIIS